MTSKTPQKDLDLQGSTSKLNQILDYIWPIARNELPKFLSMTALMFCILFNQNLIRALKDSIVITMIGTETITFLKFWGVLPGAMLMSVIYVKLINIFKAEQIFYLIVSVFLLFFALFAFYLFPNYEHIHLSAESTQRLVEHYPHFKWFILLLSNWSFSLFYVVAELWPSTVFSLLFWQFINSVTSVDESKRFYTLFGLLGQTGLVISGKFLEYLPVFSAYFISEYSLGLTKTTVSVQLALSIVLISGLAAIYIFWLLNHKVLKIAGTDIVRLDVKKKKMPLAESFKMVLSSRYIRLIAILLICYGVAINLVESPWKDRARQLYPTTEDYAAFVGSYLSYTGIFTISFVLIGSNIVRKLGWFYAAIITPVMVFVTGIVFFGVSNYPDLTKALLGGFIMIDPLTVAVSMGAVQNVLSKSSKYTVFDSTKEMSYVPLEPELKTKGKAAADVVGVKLGKSASAFLQHLVFILIPTMSYEAFSSYLMVVFALVCIIWIWATRELNKEYLDLTAKSQ
ncbi:MAG: tlcA 5 [Rickettsiaceae bacterium]|jgi:AAA family ATP:ADP antiporter|nr:tlcA 5 [Rickettsiaceae bacterium]